MYSENKKYTYTYIIYNMHTHIWGFTGGSDSKESAYNAGDQGSIAG